MALPVVKSPTFTIKIKEFKKPIAIRPMVVSEHKSLQQAMDIGSNVDLMNTISDVVTACVGNSVDSKKSERHILDFLFVQLYMTSVEDVVTSRYVCKNKVTNEDGTVKIDEETGDEVVCNTPIDVKIPLSRVAIKYPDDYEVKRIIKLNDTVKIHMCSLSLEATIEIENTRSNIYDWAEELGRLADVDVIPEKDQPRVDELQKMITEANNEIQMMYVYYSIAKIVDGDVELVPSNDFDLVEFQKWYMTLPSKINGEIDAFISDQPCIWMDIKITCPKCKYSRDIALRGLQDFFS